MPIKKKHIGWREKSRRMLVYATDMAFHHGGDGWVSHIVTKGGNNLYSLSNISYNHVIQRILCYHPYPIIFLFLSFLKFS